MRPVLSVPSCTHCGDCCQGNPVAGMLEPRQRRDHIRDGSNGGYCYYYDRAAKRCRIYPHRPWYCAEFSDLPGVEATRFPDCGMMELD